jgi:type VI secretion system protein ImpL
VIFWGIVISLLAGLVWAGISLLGLPAWTMGLVASSLLLLIAGVKWIIQRIKTRKAAKQLEGAIQEQAQEQLKTVRPDLQPEIKAMQAEFSKAVEALKTSKLSRGRKDALAVLPWYLIVGPPGAGKSTALRNSGLKFPYLSAKGGGVRGVGGTRNCDWWLTNEAVLLDTAGRYVSSEDDRPEWFAFLDTLVKYRPRRPINGLIVAVSVSELLGVDPQAAGELGQGIRERLDEITSRLRTLVPVYLVLTKCDLLPGFLEMFADLTRSERGQIWGFTVPLRAQEDASSDLLLKRFDELVSALEQRALKRLGQERRLEARERIYQFPQRFDELRKNLAEFVQPLFQDNVYQDTPVMRGLYFTSGTQELRPVERLSGSSADLFDTGQAPPEPSAEGRSYFLWDIFTKVMFQDQEMAVRSSLEEMRYRRRQRMLAAAYFTAAAALLVLPTLSYFQNKKLARQVHEAITLVQLDNRDDLGRVKDLEPLQQHLQELTQQRVEGAPFWLRLGLYQGDKLFPLAKSFYNTALRRVLLGLQHERIEQNLERFAERQDQPDWKPGSDDYGRHFEELKMYLLITWPRTPREPQLDEVYQDWLVRQMVDHWANVKGSGGEAVLERTISRHARTYIQMLAAEPEQLAFVRRDGVVRAARRALNRIPVEALEMERIVTEVGREYADLTLDEVVGAVPAMRASKRVRGAFTRNAWDQVVRSRLDNAFTNKEGWVLDRDSREDEEASRTELRTRYYQQYIQEWRDFLGSISVKAPEDVDEMQALLESLTRGKPPPFGKLFRSLAHNVQLETVQKESPGRLQWLKDAIHSKEESAQQEPQLIDASSPTGEYALGPRDVERAFANLIRFSTQASSTEDGEEKLTALDFYQDQLALVQNTLLAVKEKPGESGALLDKIKSTRETVALLVKKQESGGPILERLLLPPFQDMRTIVFAGVAQQKSNEFCEQIATPFSQLIAGRYPFVRESMRDAPLPELAEFLRPSGGTLRKFIQQQLADEVLSSGRKWTYASLQAREMYREDLLTFLEKANGLATTLFPGDTVDPLVRFQVRVRAGTSPDTSASEIASVTLTIDGADELYRNGPDNIWKPMVWPGPAGKLGAHIHVVNAAGATADIDEPGEWGLFRLLERVKRIEPSGDGRFFTAVWEIADMNGAQVAIDFRPERTANPFFGLSGSNTSRLLQIFRDPGLHAPQGIARGGKGCPEPVSMHGAP